MTKVVISNRLNPDKWDLHVDGEWFLSRHDFKSCGSESDVESVIDLLTNLQSALQFELAVVDGEL